MRKEALARGRLYDWACLRTSATALKNLDVDPLACGYLELIYSMRVCDELVQRQRKIIKGKRGKQRFINPDDLFDKLVCARDLMASQIIEVLSIEGVDV